MAASESEAREAAEMVVDRQRQARMAEMTGGSMVTLSSLATVDEDTEAIQRLNLVIKGDSVRLSWDRRDKRAAGGLGSSCNSAHGCNEKGI